MDLLQFYALPNLYTTYDIPSIVQPQLDLFPELAVSGAFNSLSAENIKLHNNRVSFGVKVGEDYSMDFYKDRWVWVLGILDYMNTPIGVVRNPTGQIDAYPNLFITRPAVYREAVTYLWTLMKPDYEPVPHPLEYMPLSGTLTPHPLKMNPIPEYPLLYIEKAIQQSINYNPFR